jgi:hypothetical protein
LGTLKLVIEQEDEMDAPVIASPPWYISHSINCGNKMEVAYREEEQPRHLRCF